MKPDVGLKLLSEDYMLHLSLIGSGDSIHSTYLPEVGCCLGRIRPGLFDDPSGSLSFVLLVFADKLFAASPVARFCPSVPLFG